MTYADDLGLTAFHEPLTRVDANRLEQAIPCGPIAGIRHDKRLCNERREQRNDASRLDTVARANTFRSVEREAAGEDRQTGEERALDFTQELVAPVDRRLQRGLTVEAPVGAGEKTESIVEALGDLLRREMDELSGSELQRERDAVEAAAYVDYRGLVTRENVGPCAGRGGAFHEEL